MGNSELVSKGLKPIVMVTNDLTFQVAIDAIAKGASVIVSYRGSHSGPKGSNFRKE